MTMFDLLPNQAQGFARSAGDAFYPNLWAKYICGMAPCLGLGGKNMPDVSPLRYDAAITGSAYSMTASPIGPAIYFSGNAAAQWTTAAWGLPTKCGGGDAGVVTIQAFFKYAHQESATYMCLFRSDNPAGIDTLYYGYGLVIEANADKVLFFTNRGGSVESDMHRQWPLASSSLTPGKWHSLIVTYYPWDSYADGIGQSVVMNLDGRFILPSAPTEDYPVHNSTKNARCGAMTGATTPDFEIALLNVWNRRLAWRQIDQLQLDPLAMFRRRDLIYTNLPTQAASAP